MQSHSTFHRTIATLTAGTVLLILEFAAPAQAAKFLGLGDLAGGFFDSAAVGVSANGSVVVGTSNSASGNQAFRWTSGSGMVGLDDLAGGAFASGADDVSADGSVVVGQGISASGSEAFRWTSAGGMVGLGDLGGGSFTSNAHGVSADGAVVVGSSSSTSGPEAFRWTSATGMVGLGDLPGGPFSSAAADVSADGAVIVGSGNSSSGIEAFRWTSTGGLVGLGDLAGGVFASSASAASADGAVVVGGSDSASGSEAFRWTECSGMVGLGDLDGGGFFSDPYGVSADGSVVVGISTSATGFEPFIWDSANGMRSVRDVISPSVGAALNGWTLTSVEAVSGDGRTVVGYGTSPNGNLSEAWLAYLADQVFWFPKTSGAWDSSLSWSGPFLPGPADDVVIDPTAAVTVTGASVHQTVNSLSIGGSGVGRVTLRLAGATSGDLNVATYAYLQPNAELVLADGRIFSALTLYNSGLVRGTGTINADLINYAGGEVRVAAGESLVVSGFGHTNDGKLEAIGGALEFIGAVTNTAGAGLITGRSATLRFEDGLTNNGAVGLSFGTSDLFVTVTNSATGVIAVAGNSQVTFYDDVTNNGTLNVAGGSTAVFLGALAGNGNVGGGDVQALGDLVPGSSPGLMQFGGNLTLGPLTKLKIELGGLTAGSGFDTLDVAGSASLAGILDVSLINGFAPLAGQQFTVLSADTIVNNGLVLGGSAASSFSLLVGSSSVILQAIGTGLAGDFNGNGVVDAADYTVWRDHLGQSFTLTNENPAAATPGVVDQEDYAFWKSRFGEAAGSGSGDIGATSLSSVPEPSVIGLSCLAMLAVLRARVGHNDAP